LKRVQGVARDPSDLVLIVVILAVIIAASPQADIWSRYGELIDFINAPMPGKYLLCPQKLGYEVPYIYTLDSP
jgi:hypothetical protein